MKRWLTRTGRQGLDTGIESETSIYDWQRRDEQKLFKRLDDNVAGRVIWDDGGSVVRCL
ncbi:MAG TPA: hypothetical protein VNI77_05755 [Nitrososphaera sp.]|nr:hypothetical protein [Nitrososphaera sp.]